ncbi:MAG: divalent-cation tolerance protein CutA [Akkermansiaceae bacterium]
MTNTRIVLTNFSDQETAEAIAETLVEKGLVACVSLLPGATSIYRWGGKLTKDSEVLGILKTTRERVGDLEQALLELHPYDVPEFLVLTVEGGSEDYLNWLTQESSA